jgi:multiple sugar transport system permease protein
MKALLNRKIAYVGVGWLMVGAFMLPFLWMVLGSFKTTVDFLSYPPVWLFEPTL